MSEKRLSYDLAEEMLATLEAEFKPSLVASQAARSMQGGGHEAAAATLARVGRAWMRRVRELGEQYPGQTYLNIKAAVAETGDYFFPHVPQRFLEIAYLGAFGLRAAEVLQNNRAALVHRMSGCALYQEIEARCGPEAARLMLCSHFCRAGLYTLYERLGLQVTVAQEATQAQSGHCLFAARPHGSP